MTRRAALLQKFVHFLTAFTILMKALAKLEHPEGYTAVITLFLAASIYIVVITLLHDRLTTTPRSSKPASWPSSAW